VFLAVCCLFPELQSGSDAAVSHLVACFSDSGFGGVEADVVGEVEGLEEVGVLACAVGPCLVLGVDYIVVAVVGFDAADSNVLGYPGEA
jgi:hypothetical protein